MEILLDDGYVPPWLQQFEQALGDSPLVAEYMRFGTGGRSTVE